MSKKRIFTECEISQIIHMYHDGETYSVIGKALHTKAETVSKILKDRGYGIRPKNTLKNHDYLSASRKYKVNENYFEKIDSEPKAYWLGFLYADGYIYKLHDSHGHEKGGGIELTLKLDDWLHIYHFAEDIKSTHPIIIKDVTLNGSTYKACKLGISSVKIADDLIKLGCKQCKSLVLQPPKIDQEFIPHFVRGYFDGDGCVYYNLKTSDHSLSILGTKEMLEFIKSVSKISPKITVTKVKNKNIYNLQIRGKESVATFLNYIYKNKSIFLDRKYQKSLHLMKDKHLQITHRSETAAMADLLD